MPEGVPSAGESEKASEPSSVWEEGGPYHGLAFLAFVGSAKGSNREGQYKKSGGKKFQYFFHMNPPENNDLCDIKIEKHLLNMDFTESCFLYDKL